MPSLIVDAPAADTNSMAPPSQLESETISMRRLLEVSTIVLEQAVDLVDNSLTCDEQLTTHSQFMPGSTIGA